MKRRRLFFGDPFRWVPNLYFGKFGRSAMARLRAAHPGHVAFLEPLAEAFEADAGLIVENDEIKEQEVARAEGFIDEFGDYVCDVAEGAIRYAAGGSNGSMYREFFPEGKSEFSSANKGTMPVLVERLRRMAVKHGASLPADVAARLQGFEAGWKAAFEAQEAGKASVSEVRTDQSDTRVAYTKGIVKVMHEIAATDPCNEELGRQYFDFNILEERRARKAESGAETAAPVA
ncbi:MAG: hypothetical protein EOO11_16090 [Chitinophagaceae bacterium]|nr:MAG: hypothetical protein EOO11_16090 [Chitinophagaceae bacterium]